MNTVILTGRLTADVDLRYVGKKEDTAVGRVTIAVNRPFKNADGEYEADFIRLQAWNKTAEFLEEYVKKGELVTVVGRITTGSYENDENETVYTTEVTVERVELLPNKKADEDKKEKKGKKGKK